MITKDWLNALPGEKNTWNTVKGLIAYNTIVPVFYVGQIAGSEFLTYNAGKVYFALDIIISCDAGAGASPGYVVTYDMANAVSLFLKNISAFWNTTGTAPNYIQNTAQYQNIWFSRIVGSIYSYIQFNGYRLNT